MTHHVGGADQRHNFEVLRSREQFRGSIFSVVSDEVAMPGGGSAQRDYVRHVGAAAAAAVDEVGRIVLVHQYRHPVRAFLWELPAGISDVHGESGLQTARRELAEEVDLQAGRWDLLVELHSSPGFSDELIRVFLARELTAVSDTDRHTRRHEEAVMTSQWFALDEAVAMVLRGEITNGPAVAGVLAAARAREENWASLRPAS